MINWRFYREMVAKSGRLPPKAGSLTGLDFEGILQSQNVMRIPSMDRG